MHELAANYCVLFAALGAEAYSGIQMSSITLKLAASWQATQYFSENEPTNQILRSQAFGEPIRRRVPGGALAQARFRVRTCSDPPLRSSWHASDRCREGGRIRTAPVIHVSPRNATAPGRQNGGSAREAQVPAGKLIHVILDNYAAHKHPKVRQWLDRHQRFTFHFVPTSCSWLNAVEGFFAKLAKRRLKRGVFYSLVDLQAAISRFVAEHNTDPTPFTWTADPDKIIAAVRRGHQQLDSIH